MPVKRESASGFVEITTALNLGFAANKPRVAAGCADCCVYDESVELLAGQYYDEETNLHYNWHRYYDPKKGRYITSDPIGLNGGINTYGYANQNPLSYIDTNGLNAGTIGSIAAAICASNPQLCAATVGTLAYALAETVSGIASAVSGLFGGDSSSPEDCDNYLSEPGDDGHGLGPEGAVSPLANSSPVASGGGGFEPEGPDDDKTRSSALNQAKEKGGIPRSQQPSRTYSERLTDQPGNTTGRVYEYIRAKDGALSLIHI